jgi:hypothetical protein
MSPGNFGRPLRVLGRSVDATAPAVRRGALIPANLSRGQPDFWPAGAPARPCRYPRSFVRLLSVCSEQKPPNGDNCREQFVLILLACVASVWWVSQPTDHYESKGRVFESPKARFPSSCGIRRELWYSFARSSAPTAGSSNRTLSTLATRETQQLGRMVE